MSDKKDLCANGKVGYDITTGKAYTPHPACKSPSQRGSIYCDNCRVAAGGLPL